MRRTLPLLTTACLLLAASAGCSTSNTRTVRSETTTYPTGQTAVERETTVTATESPEQSGGVLSGTVNAAGEVIALPFRAVGGLLSAIF